MQNRNEMRREEVDIRCFYELFISEKKASISNVCGGHQSNQSMTLKYEYCTCKVIITSYSLIILNGVKYTNESNN